MTAVTERAEIKEEGQVCLFLHKGNAHERSGRLKLSSEWRHQPRIHPQRSALLRNSLIADGFYNRLKSKQFIGWQNSQILECYRKGRRWDYKRFPVVLWNVFEVYAMNSEKYVSSAFVDPIQFPQSRVSLPVLIETILLWSRFHFIWVINVLKAREVVMSSSWFWDCLS